MQPLAAELRTYILETLALNPDGSFLRDSDSLLDKGIVDSTGVLELIAFLEDRFGVTVAYDEIVPENLDSIDRLVAFINKKRVEP
jgi:acyl carrier protein